jgi:hypothetical protein
MIEDEITQLADVFGDKWEVSVSETLGLVEGRYYRSHTPTTSGNGFAKNQRGAVRVSAVIDTVRINIVDCNVEREAASIEEAKAVLGSVIDEAESLAEREFMTDLLTRVDGLGPSRAAQLHEEYGTIDAVVEASVDDIIDRTGVERTMFNDTGWPDEALVASHERGTND